MFRNVIAKSKAIYLHNIFLMHCQIVVQRSCSNFYSHHRKLGILISSNNKNIVLVTSSLCQSLYLHHLPCDFAVTSCYAWGIILCSGPWPCELSLTNGIVAVIMHGESSELHTWMGLLSCTSAITMRRHEDETQAQQISPPISHKARDWIQ